jgi:hypothetical protein
MRSSPATSDSSRVVNQSWSGKQGVAYPRPRPRPSIAEPAKWEYLREFRGFLRYDALASKRRAARSPARFRDRRAEFSAFACARDRDPAPT